MAFDEPQFVDGLIEVVEHLTSDAALDVRLSNLCRAVVRMAGCERCSVFLLVGEHYEARYSSAPLPEAEGGSLPPRVPLRDPLISRAIQTGECVVFADAEHSARNPQRTGGREGIVVAAPVFGKGRSPLGFLAAEYRADAGALDRTAGRLLSGVAKLAATAVSAARRGQQRAGGDAAGVAADVAESTRAEEEKAALLDLAREVSRTLDLEEILDHVQLRVTRLLPCGAVLTFYWDPKGEVFRMISQHGVPPAMLTSIAALEFRLGQPLTEALSAGQTVQIDDTAEHAWLPAGLLARFRSGAIVAAPLVVHGRFLGALVAVNQIAGGHFGGRQVQLFEGIARHVAVAIETSELYRTQQSEAQVDAALAKVGRELIASLNTPALLDRLCQLTTEVLGCDYSCTLLWQPEDNAYVPAACHGATAEEWEAVRLLKLSRGAMVDFIERLEREEVFQVNEQLLDQIPAVRLSVEYGISTSIHIALRRGNETIGFHAAGYRGRQEPFTPQQERIARGIAQLASLALETARLVEELERASRLKSEFVATMSHELRTPLNIILGYNDLLLEHAFGPLTLEQADTLRRVDKSARELLDLITSTLDLSRLEAGRMTLDLREAHLADLINEIDVETRPLREKRDFTFAQCVPSSLPSLHTDPLKLKVVLKNLIVNALKFTERGSVTVNALSRDGGLEICVVDTGIGMAPETLPVIFEPFRQVDGFKTRHQGGVGLGLYIVRRLLEMLGGTISVDSQLGQGSAFRVWVPTRIPSGREPAGAPVFDS